MADTAYVRNINGVEVAPAGDSFVYFVPQASMEAYFEEEMQEAVTVGEGDTFFDNLDLRNISVGRLLAIAEVAEAVLDSEAGVQSLHELATAIEAAGFVPDGYYTSLYTGAAEEDEA